MIERIDYLPASPREAATLATIRAEGWMELYGPVMGENWVRAEVAGFLSKDAVNDRARRIREAQRPNADDLWLTARMGNWVLGYVEGRKKPVQELHGIWLLKRGRGTGTAQGLINRFHEWTDPKKPIVLDVAAVNDRAIRFYARNGYTIVNKKSDYHGLRMVTMRRRPQQ